MKRYLRYFLAGFVAKIIYDYLGGQIPKPELPFNSMLWSGILIGVFVLVIAAILERFLA
jgi:hypothetical protein